MSPYLPKRPLNKINSLDSFILMSLSFSPPKVVSKEFTFQN